MAEPLLPDDLWAVVAPPLPTPLPKSTGGRPRGPDRAALTGIWVGLKRLIACRDLAPELGYGSRTVCWRRLRDWQQAVDWRALHRALLDRLGEADQCDRIDWNWASLDSASGRATRGPNAPARTRLTAAKRARRATLWSTPAASRSPRT